MALTKITWQLALIKITLPVPVIAPTQIARPFSKACLKVWPRFGVLIEKILGICERYVAYCDIGKTWYCNFHNSIQQSLTELRDFFRNFLQGGVYTRRVLIEHLQMPPLPRLSYFVCFYVFILFTLSVPT